MTIEIKIRRTATPRATAPPERTARKREPGALGLTPGDDIPTAIVYRARPFAEVDGVTKR